MQALGLIETYGFVAAVEAADAALKAANVSLQNLKFVRGGLVTVSFLGDVGAVKAAVDAGCAAASKVGTVLSTHVIPRPAEGVDKVMLDKDTPPSPPKASPQNPVPSAPPKADLKMEAAAAIEPPAPVAPAAPAKTPAPSHAGHGKKHKKH